MSEEITHGRDLTSGSIIRQLWSLAWPIMLSIFFFTLYNIVDTIWVGRLSAEAIAAVSISQIALFAMVALGMGITVGSGVLISMHIGAKEHKEAERVLGQSFVLSGILGIFFTIVALVFKDNILVAAGASGLVYEPASIYFTITAAGSILMFILMTIVFAFNAQGDSFTPTKLFAISTLLNVILDPLLIFGWGIVPAFGIAGAAYATLTSQLLFLVIAIRTLNNERQLIPFYWRNLSFNWISVKKVLNIGIPAALTQVIQPIALSALMFITAKYFYELGTVAFSIAFRLEFFAYLPAIGFGVAAMAMIAQSIGAKNFNRVKEVYYTALKLGVGTSLVVGLVAIIFAKPAISIFTTNGVVVDYVTSYLWIVAGSYGFLAASMIVINVFQAMDKSWSGFWLFIVRYLLVTIPIAYVLVGMLGYSIKGIWIALALGNISAALIGFWWVRDNINKLIYESNNKIY